jgi:hypothetical protein
MPAKRWLDTTQPQTLLIATILLYVSAGEELLLGGGLFNPIWLLIAAGQVGAGFGISNEKKWGYGLAIGMAFLPFVINIIFFHNPLAGTGLITLMFEVALCALLLHPQSREYQRIWFK